MKKTFRNIRRIIKNLCKTMHYIHKKDGIMYTFLFFDIIMCFIIYGITYNEYRIFEFYNVKSNKRKTYISSRKYKKLRKKLVSEDIVNVINDKKLFLRRFKDYISYDIYNVDDISFKTFEDFAFSNKRLIARSDNKSFISSYVQYDINNYRSPAFALKDIKDNKLSLVFKNIKQHKSLNDISELVVINIVSVVNYDDIDIVNASIKFRCNNKIITGNININTGKVTGHFKDEKGHNYNEYYDGFKIPYFEEIKDKCILYAHEIEEIRQVEWSIIIGEKGKLYLIDANIWTDYVFAQIREFLNDNIGLMSYYNKIL